jgi:hypothetical protein
VVEARLSSTVFECGEGRLHSDGRSRFEIRVATSFKEINLSLRPDHRESPQVSNFNKAADLRAAASTQG